MAASGWLLQLFSYVNLLLLLNQSSSAAADSVDLPLPDPLSRSMLTIHGFWEDFGEYHEEPALVSDSQSMDPEFLVENVTSPADIIDWFVHNALRNLHQDSLTLMDVPPIFDNVTVSGVSQLHAIGQAVRDPASPEVIIGHALAHRLNLSALWMQDQYHGWINGHFLNVQIKFVVKTSPSPVVIGVHATVGHSVLDPYYDGISPMNFWLRRSTAQGPCYQLKVLVFQILQKILLKAANQSGMDLA